MSFYSWLHHLIVQKVMEHYFSRCCSGQPFQNNEDKVYEFQRLNSFQNWPVESDVFPIKLAKAGFYYENNSDEVTCFHCGVKRSDWDSRDDPFEIHKSLNPQCEFISQGLTENIPLSSEETPSSERSTRLDRLLEIQEQSYFPYDCVILGEAEPSSKTQAVIPSSSSYGDLSVTHQQEPINTETSEPGEAAMSKPKSDSPSKKIRTGGNPGTRRSPVPGSSATGRGTNVADRAEPASTRGSSPTASGNKTKKDTTKAAASDLDVPPPTGSQLGPLRFERNRLETYKDWPSSDCVPPSELAKWGFYYTGAGDRVKCIFCKGILRNWESGDRPHIEHRKHFPRCPLILGMKIGNVPLPLDLNASPESSPPLPSQQQVSNVSDAHSNMETLGIITERPKHPQYAVESQRLASFERWPPYKYQTPQKLASAGFWYAGFNDNVKCFYCNGGLRNWEPGDEPWVEHARWFPRCPFVKQVKGQDFINKVQREKGVPGPENTGAQAPSAAAAATGATNPPSAGTFVVEEREIRARMDRPHVKMVQDMGYSRELIMKALRKRFAETGDDFPSATALLEGLFDLEEDETQSTEPPEAEAGTENQTADNSADPQEVTSASQDPPDIKQPGTTDKKEKEGKDEENKENIETAELTKPDRDELEKENLELKEQRLCKICMTEQAAVVFLPCGHLVLCASCSPALQDCPICRAEIKGVVRTYLA